MSPEPEPASGAGAGEGAPSTEPAAAAAAPAPAQEAPRVSASAPPPMAPSVPPQLPAVSPVTVPGLPDPDAEAAEDEEDLFDPEAVSQEELRQAIDEIPEIPADEQGAVHRGIVVSVTDTAVYVDFGAKVEGVLARDEIRKGGELLPVHPGDEVEVQVVRMGPPGEYAELSYYDAEEEAAWERIRAAHQDQTILPARVIERVKGGLRVDIGLPAFLPGSQVDIHAVHDLDSLVGQEVEVRVVKLNRKRKNIVISRRALLEEQRMAERRQTLERLEEGAVVNGMVKSLTAYGAFVDLGGIDGLLHVTDMSYGRLKHPSELLQPGQAVTAKVIRFDPSKERVSLSLKDLKPDPWENIHERYQVGQKITSPVVSVTDYGAFVELEDGLEGLIHVSEMNWSRRRRHPSKVFQRGQQVEAVILQIDPAERRISLSVKSLLPDPWAGIEERYQVGSVVEGVVRNLTSYGAFVELEEGVDGLIHVSDLSWDGGIQNPKQVLKKSQRLRAAVLQVDPENRKISLGIKQLEPDGWETFCSSHVLGDIVEGAVTRHTSFGAFVELAAGVEGLCHVSEMPQNGKRKRGPALEQGARYRFRLIKLDELGRRISLSCRGVPQEPVSEAEFTPASTGPPPEMPTPPPQESQGEPS